VVCSEGKFSWSRSCYHRYLSLASTGISLSRFHRYLALASIGISLLLLQVSLLLPQVSLSCYHRYLSLASTGISLSRFHRYLAFSLPQVSLSRLYRYLSLDCTGIFLSLPQVSFSSSTGLFLSLPQVSLSCFHRNLALSLPQVSFSSSTGKWFMKIALLSLPTTRCPRRRSSSDARLVYAASPALATRMGGLTTAHTLQLIIRRPTTYAALSVL
jgi:hypothetical protein